MSQFADDTAVYASSQPAIHKSAQQFIDSARTWGLTVNISKTKAMVLAVPGNTANTSNTLQVGSEHIEILEQFPYLGSVISCSGDLTKEVSYRISRASRAFGSLNAAIFRNKTLSVGTKQAVYTTVILPTLLYGAETWTVKHQISGD